MTDGHDACEILVVDAQDHKPEKRDLVDEGEKGLLNVIHAPVEIEVFEVDVGNHRNR